MERNLANQNTYFVMSQTNSLKLMDPLPSWSISLISSCSSISVGAQPKVRITWPSSTEEMLPPPSLAIIIMRSQSGHTDKIVSPTCRSMKRCPDIPPISPWKGLRLPKHTDYSRANLDIILTCRISASRACCSSSIAETNLFVRSPYWISLFCLEPIWIGLHLLPPCQLANV